MMKLDSTKMMLLAALGIGAYFITMKRAVAGTGTGGNPRTSTIRPGYSATPNAYKPPSATNQNAAGWGQVLGGLWQGFTGMNGNASEQAGYGVGPSANSRAARDAADANDIFMPGYGTGDSTNSRSSRDAYDNTDSNVINPPDQYEVIPNNGWGEG